MSSLVATRSGRCLCSVAFFFGKTSPNFADPSKRKIRYSIKASWSNNKRKHHNRDLATLFFSHRLEKQQQKMEAFSFKEIRVAEDKRDPVPLKTVIATDGEKLAVRVYRPAKSTPTAVLLFYHGGGAHSLASYQHIGRGLSEQYDMVVYMPDLRGHGVSGGPRGDSPSSDQMFQDINSVLELIEINEDQRVIPSKQIFLGGHSSGGGLVVNYSAWSNRMTVAGYILVSPELGYLSKTERPGRVDFASVSILPFILHGIFGIMGHNKAVKFKYPSSILEKDPALVCFNTVNMANAITPTSPKTQFESIELPLGLWVGADDELFSSEAVLKFVEEGKENSNENTCGVLVEGKNHLGILIDIHRLIGPWIQDLVK